jgi:hypothetical protein
MIKSKAKAVVLNKDIVVIFNAIVAISHVAADAIIENNIICDIFCGSIFLKTLATDISIAAKLPLSMANITSPISASKKSTTNEIPTTDNTEAIAKPKVFIFFLKFG